MVVITVCFRLKAGGNLHDGIGFRYLYGFRLFFIVIGWTWGMFDVNSHMCIFHVYGPIRLNCMCWASVRRVNGGVENLIMVGFF